MPDPTCDVRLEQIDGEWTVFVVEDGETLQQTFETKQFAKNFAKGQRIRLGLPKFIKPAETRTDETAS